MGFTGKTSSKWPERQSSPNLGSWKLSKLCKSCYTKSMMFYNTQSFVTWGKNFLSFHFLFCEMAIVVNKAHTWWAISKYLLSKIWTFKVLSEWFCYFQVIWIYAETKITTINTMTCYWMCLLLWSKPRVQFPPKRMNFCLDVKIGYYGEEARFH